MYAGLLIVDAIKESENAIIESDRESRRTIEIAERGALSFKRTVAQSELKPRGNQKSFPPETNPGFRTK